MEGNIHFGPCETMGCGDQRKIVPFTNWKRLYSIKKEGSTDMGAPTCINLGPPKF